MGSTISIKESGKSIGESYDTIKSQTKGLDILEIRLLYLLLRMRRGFLLLLSLRWVIYLALCSVHIELVPSIFCLVQNMVA